MLKFLTAPRLPFLGLVFAAVAGIIVADFFPANGAVFSLLAITWALSAFLLLRWPNLGLTYLAVSLGFFLLHGVRVTDTPGQWLAARLGDRPRAVWVTGAVVTEPKSTGSTSVTFLLELQSIELEGKTEPANARMLVRWRGRPKFGDELRLFGIALPLSPPRNPGEFDMRNYLARQDVYRRLTVRYAEDGVLIRHRGGNPILRLAQECRNRIQAIICRDLDDSPEVRDLIGGVALGLRHQAPEDIEEPFQQTGTLHLFAVAGLHVGIVAQLLWIVTSVARLPRKWATLLIIPLLLFYSAVTGLHVSSMRAAIMSAFLFGGFLFERKAFSLNSLAAAAFVLLCWNTNEIFSTGFQLSFAVVGAILLLAGPLARWIRRWNAPDPFLPRGLLSRPQRASQSVWGWLAQGTSVSLAAWIGSLVLILWYFYLITPISLFANLVVVPIAFFLLAIALLSLLAAPALPWLSVVFNNANWFLAKLVLVLVQLFAQVPGGHHYLEHPRWPDGARATVDVLDLAPGAAAHIQAEGKDWLLDCGSERDYERVVREYLHATGVNALQGVLLTHGDSLHIGGVARLLSDLRPGIIIDNAAPDRSIVHRRLRGHFEKEGVATRPVAAGHDVQLADGVSARILFPPPGFSAAAADDQSLVTQLQIGAVRILFVSDSGLATEEALVASGVDLRSDILVKGQNHSIESGSDAFLEAVQPQLIIASSLEFPERERIKDEWAEKVRARGIRLFRQDQTGAVQMRFRPNDWEARAYLTGEVLRSSSR